MTISKDLIFQKLIFTLTPRLVTEEFVQSVAKMIYQEQEEA